MGRITRRKYLATASAVSLSGCVGTLSGKLQKETETPTPPPDSDGDKVPDTDDDYPDSFLRAHRIRRISERITLDVDNFKAYTIDAQDRTLVFDYEAIVPSGKGIDVFVLEREEYLKYNDGEEASYLTEYSFTNVKDAVLESHPISDGRYRIVLDHTAYATDYRDVSIEVDFSLDIGRPANWE